ncbi:MAG: hypothetical protein RID05_07600 [Cytophagales bacterium]
MPNPGNINNPNGRPKGSKNKKTKQWEVLQESILERHTQKFNETLDSLEGMDFIETYLKVLSYFKPKMKAVEQKRISNDKIKVFYHNPGECPPERKIKDDGHIYIDFKDAE